MIDFTSSTKIYENSFVPEKISEEETDVKKEEVEITVKDDALEKVTSKNENEEENKLAVQEKSNEIFYKNQLSTSLKKLIEFLPEPDLNFTLKEYLILQVNKIYLEQKNCVQNIGAYGLIINMLNSNAYNPKIFNENWNIFLEDSAKPFKIYFQLIVQLGQKSLNQPLGNILDIDFTLETQSQFYLRKIYFNIYNIAACSIQTSMTAIVVLKTTEYIDEMQKGYDTILNIGKNKKLALNKRQIKHIKKCTANATNENSNTVTNNNQTPTKDLNKLEKTLTPFILNSNKICFSSYIKKLYDDQASVKNTIKSINALMNVKNNNIKINDDYLFLKLKTTLLLNQEQSDAINESTLNIFMIKDKKGSDLLESNEQLRLLAESEPKLKKIATELIIKDSSFINDFKTNKTHLNKFQDNIETNKKIIHDLIENYELIHPNILESEILHSLTTMLLVDEIEVNYLRENKLKQKISKQQHSKSKKTNHNDKSKRNKLKTDKSIIHKPPESLNLNETILTTQEQIFYQHSWLSHLLTQNLKNDLNLKCKKADLSNDHLKRAKIHSKELRDHLMYASQNFELFCKAFLNQDFYALGAIVPFLFLDQHLVIEQFFKHNITLNKKAPVPSHDLAELHENSSCNVPSSLMPFIQNFKNAMLESRYPNTFKSQLRSDQSLNWILYCDEVCKILNQSTGYIDKKIDPNYLQELCNYVFDSYLKMLQLVLELSPDLNMQTSFLEMNESFKTLKGILEKAISNVKGDFTVNSIEVKNLRANKQNLILSNHQKLTDIFSTILSENENPHSKLLSNEASDHLLRIDAANYLQENYDNLQFAGLHHRNLLMFQWVYELIYRFYGHTALLKELRWTCSHNLEAFQNLAFPSEQGSAIKVPLFLNEFNFGRNLHYTHEKGESRSLPMIKELLQTRKFVKKLVYSDSDWLMQKNQNGFPKNIVKEKGTFASNRIEILEKGNKVLDQLINLLTIKSI